jgi:transcriptional regulator with XRE-family HTH domain
MNKDNERPRSQRSHDLEGRASKKVRVVLGARVRTLREDRGYTQRALGRRAKLSGKFIGEVERGEKSITIDSLYRVAQALKTPLGELTSMNGHARKTRKR